MPVPVTSQFVRQNGADFPVADTIDLAGGLMSVADVVARDAVAINSPSLLRAGMMIYTEAEDRYWKLLTLSPVVWEQLGVEGSTLASAYAAGSAPTDQTIPVAAVQGGPPTFKAAAAATGSLLKALTSAAVALLDITDNASQVIRSAVADGAGAVGIVLDTVNDITTGKVASIRSAGVEQLAILQDAFSTYLRGKDYAFFQVTDLTGLFLAPVTFSIQVAGTTVLKAFGSGIQPNVNNAYELGGNSRLFSTLYANRYGGIQRDLSAAATITLDRVLGVVQRITLGATAITTINGSLGKQGETMVVEVIQDGVGGRSILGWSTGGNGFLLAGGAYVPTATANKRDALTFVWDSTTAKWVETSRSMNL